MIRAVSVRIPSCRVCVVVILHQCAEEDDEDDLQDEAGDRQPQPHVGCGVCHVFFPVRRGSVMLVAAEMD